MKAAIILALLPLPALTMRLEDTCNDCNTSVAFSNVSLFVIAASLVAMFFLARAFVRAIMRWVARKKR